MTVRVTKPEFNLREKISELDNPTGLKGSELMRSETPQEARDLIGAGRKNLLINGDMRIDQRSNGSATTPSGTSFTSVDRWKAVIAPGSKFSMQKKSDGTLLEKAGFPNYMRLTVTLLLLLEVVSINYFGKQLKHKIYLIELDLVMLVQKI